MGSLANKKIGESFKDLLQISNNNSGIDNTVRFIEDGEGTQSVLGLDSSKITIDGHILPTTNAAFDIGSADKKIRHLYLSDNSLYVGDVKISSVDASNVKSLNDGTYATTADMNAGMATKADVTALNDYATTADMNAGMTTKADTAVMLNALLGHPTHIDLTNGLDTKADVSALSDYATTADMNAGMATKADTSSMTDALNNFYSKIEIDGKLNDLPTLSDVNSTIESVIGSAPAALDTLGEIAAALGDDEDFAATITNSLATKANVTDLTDGLATKANVTDLTDGLATKANVSALDDCLKSNADDEFSGKLSVSNTDLRSAGVYGIYDSYKISHIWSMGTDYSIPDTGIDFGNLYGFAYKYVNNITGGTMAGGHQAVWCENGIPNVAIGTNLWAKNNITAYSDARVKKNIETIPDAVDKVKAIRGVTYDRIDSSEGVGKQMGVIAQELVDVIPEVVTGGPTDDDPDGHYSVAYGNIVGLLIEAIKEQQDQLEEQKQLINQLLNR